MTRYTPHSVHDVDAMLSAIGMNSVQEFFDGIPAGVRFAGRLALPGGSSEQDVFEHLAELAARNTCSEDEISFLGAGMYDHYVPAVVDMLTSRSEFLTPYTPYQPEVSQGTLQVMFEYQTAMCELTGLPVSNATLYEGASATGAAAYMLAGGARRRLLVSDGLHPHARQTLRALSGGFGLEIEPVPLSDGITDLDTLRAAVSEEVVGIVVAQPNFLGAIEDVSAIASLKAQATLIVFVDPITLGVLEAPGHQGADICVGEGQSLGNHPFYGGPSFGFICATEAYLRRMPGRIAGQTADLDGRRGYVLTLQTREQHIRRERATSNITTAQTLNALAAIVYLGWLGRRGLVDLGELLVQRTHYARERLAAIDGIEKLHDQPVVREFAVRLAAPVDRVIARCQAAGVNPGLALPDDVLLVGITERRTRRHIDRLAELLGLAVGDERYALGQTA
jgi:glycine cleavage system P protein (glycine dehydrogenase) subunit 1